ncbi:PhaM family polyhydroxyalkanoate granule multifunctional regulatory protein [Roseateles noduli]|uniref:PhaM family polyhydroxyalkanoate granule multifunctional regulatory protein n=1 Tax=Roseateles noduli TaxID=2052484 RepID=UPI003D64A56E
MADTDFSKFVPGFDFLQGLMKNAGAAIPGFNQWVAPTLDPQELDKRIDELRTVQFWLENNARMLNATIQALEVQRMTLSTLHAMNVPMADLKDVLKTQVPPRPSPAPRPQEPAAATPAPQDAPADAKGEAGGEAKGEAKAGDPAGPKPAGADPMQWWNALTQQFTQVAANAMKTAQTAATAATSAATSSASAASAPTSAAKPATRTSPGAAKKTSATSAARPAAKKAAPARKTAPKRKAP